MQQPAPSQRQHQVTRRRVATRRRRVAAAPPLGGQHQVQHQVTSCTETSSNRRPRPPLRPVPVLAAPPRDGPGEQHKETSCTETSNTRRPVPVIPVLAAPGRQHQQESLLQKSSSSSSTSETSSTMRPRPPKPVHRHQENPVAVLARGDVAAAPRLWSPRGHPPHYLAMLKWGS